MDEKEMVIHLLFDLLAYAVGTFLALKVFKPNYQIISSENLRYIYYTVVIVGAFFGAFLVGTINTYISLDKGAILGKSILGAIIGGVIAVEIFKKVMKIEGSTGAYFVPSLAIGIAIGRVGCYLTGIDDYTYGIETSSIFGVDFGDGILRHPVQLYESMVMLLFFGYTVYIYFNHRAKFETVIFYQFILLYSTQRFIWEFLKPYETIFLGLNIFQLFCLGLILYATIYLRRAYATL
ncbi:MAG: prolipoprotein diacylglyceryl transferase [Epsilonproteobacteria bacterium]|nr:prolipoprotein diacylglyceryl transferase [Campylobacterota bacterium]